MSALLRTATHAAGGHGYDRDRAQQWIDREAEEMRDGYEGFEEDDYSAWLKSGGQQW